MDELRLASCVAIESGTPALTPDEIEKYADRFKEWDINTENGHPTLSRTFKLNDFEDAVLFLRHVGKTSSEQSHYPRLIVEGNTVTTVWWSQAAGGLHLNDFIMAARCDDIYSRWNLISGERDNVEQASDESFPASDPPAW